MEKNRNEPDKALPGIWTPYAQVLCYECHGSNLPKPLTETRWKEMLAPQPVETCNGVTPCDSCHRDVQVWKETADEHNLMLALRDANIDARMAQTGGGMSAVFIDVSDGIRGEGGEDAPDHLLITYGETETGIFWMGVYDEEAYPVDVAWSNQGFSSQEKVVSWAKENEGKLSLLPDELGNLVVKAKERAAAREMGRSEGKNRMDKGIKR